MSRGYKHNLSAETIAQHYLDDRSYLSEKNGIQHEILFGLDMGPQREKVFNREKGICQVCGRFAPLHHELGEGYEGAWHHLNNKPAERCDCVANGQWTCGRFVSGCHSDQHPRPWANPSGSRERHVCKGYRTNG